MTLFVMPDVIGHLLLSSRKRLPGKPAMTEWQDGNNADAYTATTQVGNDEKGRLP